jgi:hypothetical protein
MRGIWAIGTAIIGLVIMAGSAAAAPARAPNLALCAKPASPDGGERERKRPLPVPPALRQVVKSSLYHFAVAMLDGRTVCVDTSWMETAENPVLTPGGRYFSFGWLGYETYGHLMVDRTGRGQAIETGVAPVFSPSRRYFASADQTESEFGTLSGLAVWSVGAGGTREVGRINELPRMQGWRIDSWAGESCIDLSAIPLDADPEKVRARTRYRAAPGKAGWTVSRNPRGCAAR